MLSKKRPAARKKVDAVKRGGTTRKPSPPARKPAPRRPAKKAVGKTGTSAARAKRPLAAKGPAPSGGGLVTAGLTKEQFLTQNKTALGTITDNVNTRLRTAYGASPRTITRYDVCIVFYCEAGLKNGKVDPDHTHSLGERGLLPLPSNIRTWNGSDAPAWNKPMSADLNVFHFFLYMGHLKNKDATGAPKHLYRALFQLAEIGDDAETSAKVIAGVVHGYFYDGNYSDKKAPFDYLVQNYRDDNRLSEFMATTKYVHAGKPLMVGREKNIDTGLSLV